MSRIALSFTIALLAGCSVETEPSETVETLDEPILVSASVDAMFSSWSLTASLQDGGTLEVGEDVSHIELDAAQFEELRQVVEEQRFFDLESNYGELVFDGTIRTLTVAYGGQSHTVKIRHIMNWVYEDPGKLVEPARAIRVMGVVRNWIDHPDPIDLGRYDKIVLDAVEAYR